MALIKSVRGFTPQIGENCYLADNATIIDDVIMGHDCSIWFNAVLRGDVNAIRIGNRVNIQDGSVLHTLYQKSVVEIGNNVSVGHNVTIHGATIKDGALIGMGATVLDHLPHGSFFHATGGSMDVTFKNRLKLIPYETLIGLVLALSTVGVYELNYYFNI